MNANDVLWLEKIPREWTRGRLKDLIGIVANGVWGEEPREADTNIRCVRAADFDRLRLKVSLDKLPKRSIDALSRRKHLLEKGDLILEKSGGGEKQLVGAAVLFDLNEAAVCSNFCARLRPQAGVDSRYLNYVLAAAYHLRLNEPAIKQTTGIQNLDSGAYLVTPWAWPGIEEQRRIADFLDIETFRIDRIEKVQIQAREKLLERRSSGVHELVAGSPHADQVPTTLQWVDSLPRAWPVIKLSYIARMGSGHTPSRSKPEWWEDCTIPWITTGEVRQVRDDRREIISETREKISEIGLANSAAELHPEGTVVLCRTASAGYSGVMGAKMATSQDFVTWTCGPRLDPFYLLWCLRAMRKDLLGRLAMGSTHKTIYVPDLQMLRIPVPLIEQQREIVDHIRCINTRVDAALDAIDQQLALLAERKQALITAAVTGQIDVTTARGV